MESLGAIIVGLITSVTTIIVAIVQYNKNQTARDLNVAHLEKTIDIKLGTLTDKIKGVSEDVKCIEEKVDENIRETGELKGRVIVLEQNALKGSKYANH